ncbi:importin subunit beta-1, partial [Tanacetum coccineum]
RDEDQNQEDGIGILLYMVQGNISKSDWRSREAATYAFGSSLEVPYDEKFSLMVTFAMDFFLNAMKDENNHVKDTTAWTLGCEGLEAGSSVLTPFIADIVTSLIRTAERTYASDTKLSSDKRSRFRSFHQMIEKNKEISKLCSGVFSKFLIINLAVLVKRSLLFSRLPTRLCCCFSKYSLVVAQQFMKKQCLDDKMLPYCDNIMTLLLKDLSSGDLHRSVKPPVFSCFGDVALAIGEKFEKYVPYAMPMMQGAAGTAATDNSRDIWIQEALCP